MKVAILAGGKGSRLAEETSILPKPMVEVGGRPIIWHVMMHYSHHGYQDFVIALGYKGEIIKKYMVDYASLQSDLTVHVGSRQTVAHDTSHPDWKVDLIDTGMETMTGGRIKRLGPFLDDATFMLTWGDGVSNVDLKQLLAFHRSHGKLATLTAVRPPARFGHMEFDGDRVARFTEKPQTAEGWINGAFFVLEPKVLDYIDGDAIQWEREPLEHLARDEQLMVYKHEGYWQCMDTLREKHILERMWQTGDPPWRTWE